MEANKSYITDWVHLKNETIFHQGKPIFTHKAALPAFLKQAYRFLAMDYPKFFKMDSLCKLGIIATEVLSKQNAFATNTALVFQNEHSSLVTDWKHQQQLASSESGFVSPATFVYTLPNIVLGEISIRHHLKSENAFFVNEEFAFDFMHQYAQNLLQTNKASEIISGWIDLNNDGYNVFLARISTVGNIPFTVDAMKKIDTF